MVSEGADLRCWPGLFDQPSGHSNVESRLVAKLRFPVVGSNLAIDEHGWFRKVLDSAFLLSERKISITGAALDPDRCSDHELGLRGLFGGWCYASGGGEWRIRLHFH